MVELRIIDGGRDATGSEQVVDQIPDIEFGIPKNLYFGLVSAALGAAAGLMSLICYFHFSSPDLYISPQWLMFIAAGAVVGFFMRIERPLQQHYEAAQIRSHIKSYFK